MQKDMQEMKAELKEARRRDEEEARLFEKIEQFMDGQKFRDNEKKALLRKIETLENRIALMNQAYYEGSNSYNDKYNNQKTERINDGRDVRD